MSITRPQAAPSANQPIVIIGGGISGLAAAHRLQELLPHAPLKLLESSERLGGMLQTVRDGEYLIETSADNFITKLPWAESLCERVGLADELLPTEPSLRRALVVRRGRVVPVPEAFVLMSAGRLTPVLRSPVLSFAGKLRLALEPFIPRRDDAADESVASFACRRLGNEAFQRLVQPLVAGIYTADPEKLSMRATMPQFVENEQQYGSLWRARQIQTKQTDSGARYSAFVAPRYGVSQLVHAVAQQLPAECVELSARVERIEYRAANRLWCVKQTSGDELSAAAVVVATPVNIAGRLLADVDSELATMLARIELASTSIVVLGVRRDQIKKSIKGFGFVTPQIERRKIIAASFSSTKFPGRAAEDRLLLRVFVGGALQPELASLPDDQLVELARRELSELVGLTGEPELSRVVRWPVSMPQYHVGHVELVDQIEQRVSSIAGLQLAGNAYRGVGIPQCIYSGEQAAEHVAQHLVSAQKSS